MRLLEAAEHRDGRAANRKVCAQAVHTRIPFRTKQLLLVQLDIVSNQTVFIYVSLVPYSL